MIMRGEIEHREQSRIGAQRVADRIKVVIGTDQGAAPQIRKLERGYSVAAILGSQDGKQRCILRDRKQLPIRERPPAWCEVAGERGDLAQGWGIRIEPGAATS